MFTSYTYGLYFIKYLFNYLFLKCIWEPNVLFSITFFLFTINVSICPSFSQCNEYSSTEWVKTQPWYSLQDSWICVNYPMRTILPHPPLAIPPCIKTSSHPPSVKAVSSEIKWLCKSSRPCLVILIQYTGWNRVIIGEVIIKGLSFGPPPHCLSARSLKDIGRQTGVSLHLPVHHTVKVAGSWLPVVR